MSSALIPPGGTSGFLDRLDRIVAAHKTKLLVAIFIVAVVARVGATGAKWGFEPNPPAFGDMISYDNFAKKINEGGWLGKPTSYREPVYPVFLAAVYKLAGYNPTVGRLSNAVMGGLTCLLIFSLANRLFGATVAIVSAAWAAIYYHFIFFSTMLMRESLLTLMMVVFLILMVRAVRERGQRYLIWATLVLVLLIHTDARFLFHLPFIGLFWLLSSGSWRRGFARSLLFAGVVIVGMIPWQVRNYIAYDRFVLVNTRTLDIQAKPVPAVSKGNAPGEMRRLKGARRVVYDFTEFYRAFRFRSEVRNNSTTVESPWSFLHNATGILTYGILLPFFVYGMFIIMRRRWRDGYVLIVPVVAHTLLHLIKWGRPRYRVPIEPIIVIIALFAVAYLWSRYLERRSGAAT